MSFVGELLSSLRIELKRSGDSGALLVYVLIAGSDGEVVILQAYKKGFEILFYKKKIKFLFNCLIVVGLYVVVAGASTEFFVAFVVLISVVVVVMVVVEFVWRAVVVEMVRLVIELCCGCFK